MAKLIEPKTICRTPNKPGTTRIPTWKFDAIRGAILKTLGDGPILWGDLTDKIRAHLTADQLAKMGSLGWHTVSVKLEMEVRREISRIPKKSPQVIELSDQTSAQ